MTTTSGYRFKTVFAIALWSLIHLAVKTPSWGEEHLPVSDMQRILARKKIVVALLRDDYPPLFATNNAGRLFGSHISLVEHLAQELGVQLTFDRHATSFDEIIDRVSQGKADIGLATTLTLPRAKKVLFSKPYMTLNLALLLNRVQLLKAGVAAEFRDISQLRHTSQPIGLLKGSAYLDYARQSFPKAELKEYATLPDLLAAAEKGELLAAVRNDLTAELYLHRNPASLIRLRLVVDPAAKDYLAFSVRPDSHHLLFWINSYLLIHQVNLDSSDVVDQYRAAIKKK